MPTKCSYYRALFHERVGAFIDEFITIKREHGSTVEKGRLTSRVFRARITGAIPKECGLGLRLDVTVIRV